MSIHEDMAIGDLMLEIMRNHCVAHPNDEHGYLINLGGSTAINMVELRHHINLIENVSPLASLIDHGNTVQIETADTEIQLSLDKGHRYVLSWYHFFVLEFLNRCGGGPLLPYDIMELINSYTLCGDSCIDSYDGRYVFRDIPPPAYCLLCGDPEGVYGYALRLPMCEVCWSRKFVKKSRRRQLEILF